MSNNGFSPTQIGALVATILEAPFAGLLQYLDLSYNQMPATKIRNLKKKGKMRGKLVDSPATAAFYEGILQLLDMNEIVHLNLDWMKLGDKALDLCEGLARNTSLHSIHLSNNLISKETQGKMKWFLSVGIDIQNKAFLDYYFPDEGEGGAEPGPASEAKPEEDNAGSKLSKKSLSKVPEEKGGASTLAVIPRPIAPNPYAGDHVELKASDLDKPVDEAELKLRLDKEKQPAPLSTTGGAKSIFDGPAAFELNVVNQGNLKEFRTRQKQLVNYLPAQTKLERFANIAGGVFILTRLVGHPELEPL